jgi:hypothetical protein
MSGGNYNNNQVDLHCVSVWQIDKGPRRGLWAWKIDVPQVRRQDRFNKSYGSRSGIATRESYARATAERQVRWHKERMA